MTSNNLAQNKKGLRLHFFLVILPLSLTLLLSFSGCIVPPTLESARVLPDNELKLVSVLREAKLYTRSGRLERAELYLRLAVRFAEKQNKTVEGIDSVYNDLGYVLQQQGRLEEAGQWFRSALKTNSHNVVARENLARVYYELGEHPKALRETVSLFDEVYLGNQVELAALSGEAYDRSQLPDIYRRLSNIYYTVGVLDDAICYSWLAQLSSNQIFQAGLHARLLFSLNANKAALEILRSAVVANAAKVPAQVLLDYSMALYLDGDKSLAATAASRMLNTSGGSSKERQIARVIKLLSAPAEQRPVLLETTFEDLSEICDAEELDGDHYWPRQFEDAVVTFLFEVCGEQQSAI